MSEPPSRAAPAFGIELEAGPVWQSNNTVQIPNDDNGTRFSLEQLVGSGPWPAARLYFDWNIEGGDPRYPIVIFAVGGEGDDGGREKI